MLHKCCLIHTYKHNHTETILTFSICLDLGLFMSCLCDLFFIFIIIFTMIKYIIYTHIFFFFFYNMSYYFWMITWMKNVNNSKSSTSECCLATECCLALALFFGTFNLALLIKVLLMKTSVCYVKIQMIWDYTFSVSN